jgi:hypothetical protein
MGFTSHGPLATHTYKADGPLGCDKEALQRIHMDKIHSNESIFFHMF